VVGAPGRPSRRARLAARAGRGALRAARRPDHGRPHRRGAHRAPAGPHRFVTIAGRDARGTVEVYGTLHATGPGLTTAPFALTLDDTKGEQAFFAILTDTRPAPDAVLRALKQSPIRMEDSEIASVVLPKE
jgi:hypothetical protein